MANDRNATQDGWARNEGDQRRAWLQLTPKERLEWLEGALEFASKYLGAARKKKGIPTKESPSLGEESPSL